MAKGTEDKTFNVWYKYASIFVVIVLTSVGGTITVLAFLEGTVSKGVAIGIAQVTKDVDNLKKEVEEVKGDLRQGQKELAELRTIVTSHQTAISVLEVTIKNIPDKTVSNSFIDRNFMKPEEPSYETARIFKRKIK